MIMQPKSTHFIFDGNKIIISPDLHNIIIFLQGIESEVEGFLGFEAKLESIKKQHLETLKFIEYLAKRLKDNSINFEYKLSELPETIFEKLITERSSRSEMIVLFAHLEVLLCLNIAYENNTAEEFEIRKLAMDESIVRKFLEDFCLNKNNGWGKQNPDRLKRITSNDIRKTRNSLTHFFSTGKYLSISPDALNLKARKIEKATHYKVKFLSSQDLYDIIKGAARLMIEKWSNDCRNCLANGSEDFKKRILSVNQIVSDHGSVIVRNKEINI